MEASVRAQLKAHETISIPSKSTIGRATSRVRRFDRAISLKAPRPRRTCNPPNPLAAIERAMCAQLRRKVAGVSTPGFGHRIRSRVSMSRRILVSTLAAAVVTRAEPDVPSSWQVASRSTGGLDHWRGLGAAARWSFGATGLAS